MSGSLAGALIIPERSVKLVRNILAKLRPRNRTEAAAIAHREGLIVSETE